jgi:hypothetical protein
VIEVESLRRATPQLGLGIDNPHYAEPPKCYPELMDDFRRGEQWDFPKEEIKIYQMTPIAPCNSL